MTAEAVGSGACAQVHRHARGAVDEGDGAVARVAAVGDSVGAVLAVDRVIAAKAPEHVGAGAADERITKGAAGGVGDVVQRVMPAVAVGGGACAEIDRDLAKNLACEAVENV